MRNQVCLYAAVLLLVFGNQTAGFTADQYAATIETKTYEGIAYISGGFGADERETLSQMSRDYSLKLTFAATGGAYLAQIQVTVKDNRGELWLEALSDGPWFFAKLPPGQYLVQAVFKGKALQKTAAITHTAQRTVRFYWTASHDF